MRKYEITGKTHYALGKQEGLVFRKLHYEPAKQTTPRTDTEEALRNVERIFPEIIQEMQGICDSAKYDFYQFAENYLNTLTQKETPQQCSVFGITAEHSGTEQLIGRNYDWSYPADNSASLWKIKPKDAYSSITCSDLLMPYDVKTKNSKLVLGPEDGFNDQGVFIAITAAYAEEQNLPGVPFYIAVRAVLDTCQTTKDAVKLLKKTTFQNPMNFFISDATGEMRAFEETINHKRVIKPKNGVLIQTNHYVNNYLKRYDTQRLEAPQSTTRERYDAIKNELEKNKKKTNLNKAKKILRNHSGKVCAHAGKQNLETLWSWVGQPERGKYYLAPGNPCEKQYRLKKI